MPGVPPAPEPPVYSFAATSVHASGAISFPLDLRILCVDDNQDAADSLGGLLWLTGADVRTCYDAATALEVAAGFAPDVAILDVHMPGMDGCELARRLRADATGRPLLLIAITGVSNAAARERTDAAGFDLHLTKPADPRGLLGMLAAYRAWLRATRPSDPSA